MRRFANVPADGKKIAAFLSRADLKFFPRQSFPTSNHPMPAEFTHDVFLSHSSNDKVVVRALAERLQADGLAVWFDEWILKPGDSIESSQSKTAKIEEGLERSRVLACPAEAAASRRMLCMAANALGSDWTQLVRPAEASSRRRKSGTFRFRDPLNKERRFLPLRLDDAPIKGSLAQSTCGRRSD